MNKILIFDIDDTLIMHTKDRHDYYTMNSGETLKQLLDQIKYDKIYIYTNGTYSHGYNVTKNLKIYDVALIFARDNIPIPRPKQMKPSLQSFNYVHKTIIQNIQSEKNQYYFFDDMKENLQTGKTLGWITILIHPDFVNQKESYIDYAFPNIYQALVYFQLKE
tara:strand:- start:1714 stop:2202 length:489 start_codon:yes stop_codon:yes gene_type:complete